MAKTKNPIAQLFYVPDLKPDIAAFRKVKIGGCNSVDPASEL